MEEVSKPKFTLELPAPKSKDKLGGYFLNTVKVTGGQNIATYEWEPVGGIEKARGIVYLIHGILGHTTFEWLSPNEDNHRLELRGSIVEKLLNKNIKVIGFDHLGHGRSDGLHGFINSHDEIRDIAIEIIEYYNNKYKEIIKNQNMKKIIIGMSMGGTTAIRICEKNFNLIDSYILLSPAVKPPDDMFGWHGKFLNFISPILDLLVPRLPVLKLPPSNDFIIRDAAEKDGLVYRGPIRVKTAMEFLRVYSEIKENAHLLKFKNVAIFIGGKDQIVSPTGIQQFVERIQSDQKFVFEFKEFGHDVIREVGTEKVVQKVVDYIDKYLSSCSS